MLCVCCVSAVTHLELFDFDLMSGFTSLQGFEPGHVLGNGVVKVFLFHHLLGHLDGKVTLADGDVFLDVAFCLPFTRVDISHPAARVPRGAHEFSRNSDQVAYSQI